MRNACLLAAALALALAVPAAHAHQVDSVGDYRLEIGWVVEPAISGEANGIELYISRMDAGSDPTEQEFDPERGIEGLRKDIRMELVYKDESIKLRTLEDHDVSGRYFASVNPTVDGYYQLNLIGTINETVVSKSMHPPKVENLEFISFPELPNAEIIKEHDRLKSEITHLESGITGLEDSISALYTLAYAGIALGISGIAVSVLAYGRRR